MLRIVKTESDHYPKTFTNGDGEIFMVTTDHCDFLRIIGLYQGGYIFSGEYTTLDEILEEYHDWHEVETILTIPNKNIKE